MNDVSMFDYVNHLAAEFGIVNLQDVHGNEKELILIVRNLPLLYDKSLNDFKDYEKKQEAWEAIAQLFNTGKEEVKRRWTSLREHYSRYKHEKGKGREFMEDLSFLDPYILPRRKLSLKFSQQHEDENSLTEYTKGVQYFMKGPKESILSFINAVKSRPVLYSRTHSKIIGDPNKNLAWCEVAQEFGFSVEQAKVYWKNLRERWAHYRKAYDRGEEKYVFEFYEQLSFLDPHVLRRHNLRGKRMKSKISNLSLPTKSKNFISNTDSNDQSMDNLLDEETQHGYHEYDQDDSHCGQSTESKFFLLKQEHLRTIESDSDDVQHDSLNTECNQEGNFVLSSSDYEVIEDEGQKSSYCEDSLYSVSSATNEDDIFAQSIAAELKKIPYSKKKVKLKADIYRLLFEAMED